MPPPPFLRLRFAGLALFATMKLSAAGPAPSDWKALPPIPDKEGFAYPFAGAHDGRLIVAGGANFPGKRPWEGGTKVWYDTVFVLDAPGGEWRVAGRLPRPLGYGVSLTTPEGVLCAGGSDSEQHHADVLCMRLAANGTPQFEALPPLPKPCANASGALLDRTVYVAGGIDKPEATEALHTFWSLDLDHLERGWQELEPWPGRERMLAAAGAIDGSFYLVGGAALKAGADGKPEREWLRDGWRFTPGQGWRQIADAPQVSVAAPTPMPASGGRLLLIGGDDGAQLLVDPLEHRGFPRQVFAYAPGENAWAQTGMVPLGLVTTPAVIWEGRVILPGGEKKPGFRSTEVWSLPLARP